jgi:hypothetical protein
MRTTTTNRDLDRMRAAAARGMSIAACARALGVTRAKIEWWDRQASLGFVRCLPGRDRIPPHPVVADLAMARLVSTWARLCDAAAGRCS